MRRRPWTITVAALQRGDATLTAPQCLRKPCDAELLLATPTVGRFVMGRGRVPVVSTTNRIFVHGEYCYWGN
jgi:hypothetical protein